VTGSSQDDLHFGDTWRNRQRIVVRTPIAGDLSQRYVKTTRTYNLETTNLTMALRPWLAEQSST
jgi:hypothetical protein